MTGGLGGVRGGSLDLRDLTIDVVGAHGAIALDLVQLRNVVLVGGGGTGLGVRGIRVAVRDSQISDFFRGVEATRFIKIRDSRISQSAWSGVLLRGTTTGKRVLVNDSIIELNGRYGISSVAVSKVRRSDVSSNGWTGIVGRKVRVIDTTVNQNGESGVQNPSSFPVKLKRSTVTANCESPADPAACADLLSCGSPQVIASSCDTSLDCAQPPAAWGVCALD